MAAKGNATKRKRRRRKIKNNGGEQKKDRLSSLPDDILIIIISYLPLQLAVVTETLSRRWRCLWTNIFSININNMLSEYTSEFLIGLNNTLMQITSPIIHSFTLESFHLFLTNNSQHYFDSLFYQIFDRNVRELKLLIGYINFYDTLTLPSLIFQISSLVSLELDSRCDLNLPIPINLPNLKSLRLEFCASQCESIEKLVKACPSLEELSVTCKFNCTDEYGYYRCSNPNLRRLIIMFDSRGRVEIVIDAYKLEYLAIVCPIDSWTVSFEEEPIGLREAKIVTEGRYDYLLKEEKRPLTKFDRVISKVEFLSMDVFALYNSNMSSTVFNNVIQLTLKMRWSHNIQILLLSMELCPKLHALNLIFCGIDSYDKQQFILPDHHRARTLLRGLKRIEIDAGWLSYFTPSSTFLELVEFLLRNTIDLEHFGLMVHDMSQWDCEKIDVEQNRRLELNLCKLLYQCPLVSMRCEVEFVGKFFKMSRKDGPKVSGSNGEVIPFNCSPWNGFTFEKE